MTSRFRRLDLLLLAVITALGALLRGRGLGDALFGDELSTYSIVTGHGLRDVVARLDGRSVDLNPPLSFLLARVAQGLGDPAHTLRLPAFLASVAGVPLTGLLGLRLAGRVAGLLAATLVALSPYLVLYGSEARPYALLMALVVASTLALLAAAERGGAWRWASYAALAAAAVYTHFTALFPLAGQAAWACVALPHARRGLVLASGAAAVAFLPWLPTVVENTRSPGASVIEFIEPFSPGAVREDLTRLVVGHPYVPTSAIPGPVGGALLALGVLAVVVGLVRAGRPRSRRPDAPVALALVLLLATPVAIALYAQIGTSIWDRRNLITMWPGLAVVAATLVTRAAPRWRVGAAMLLVTGAAVGAARTLEQDARRPGYDRLAAAVERAEPTGVPVVEVIAPTPGPLSSFGDVELRRLGQGRAERRDHPVLRLASPPLSAVLGAPPYAALPVPGPQAVADEAVALAHDGRLLLELPGDLTTGELTGTAPLTAATAGLDRAFDTARTRALGIAVVMPARPFLAALPEGTRIVGQRTERGLLPVSLYDIRLPRG